MEDGVQRLQRATTLLVSLVFSLALFVPATAMAQDEPSVTRDAAVQDTVVRSAATAPDEANEGETIVVHIGQYTNDLHSAMMGVELAYHIQEAGADVTLFVDREGVRMSARDQPLLAYGQTDLGTLVSSFIDEGGTLLVCPHCAELAGVDASELREGAKMGTKESVAELFLSADKVVDY